MTHPMDELLTEKERELITTIANDLPRRCPFLKKAGDCFYYCGKGIPESITPQPDTSNRPFRAHVDNTEIQFWCMDRYENCIFYKEIEPARGTLPVPEEN